jgi:hypothetical protein
MQTDGISYDFLKEAIGRDRPKIIKEYKHSCLVLGWGKSEEPLHAVIALGTVSEVYDTPILVTVYRPDKDPKERWKEDYETRK